MQACKDPDPELFRFVTLQTTPPRPPLVETAPKPSASGKARKPAAGGGGGAVTIAVMLILRVSVSVVPWIENDLVPTVAELTADNVQVVLAPVVGGHDPDISGSPLTIKLTESVMLVRESVTVVGRLCPGCMEMLGADVVMVKLGG